MSWLLDRDHAAWKIGYFSHNNASSGTYGGGGDFGIGWPFHVGKGHLGGGVSVMICAMVQVHSIHVCALFWFQTCSQILRQLRLSQLEH
jgi:uncharacterized membrane protein